MPQSITTVEELQEFVAAAPNKRAVVDFGASWCGPCKQIKPVFERLAETHAAELGFATVDIDEGDELALAYGVTAVPTFGFFALGEDGKLILASSFAGNTPSRLEETIKEFKTIQ